MLAKIAVLSFLFATPIFCDTVGFYQRIPSNSNSVATGNENKYYEQIPSNAVAQPRFSVWNPFEFLSIENLFQPAVTVLGVLIAVLGSLRILDFVMGVIAITNQKKVNAITAEDKKVKEESNEVEEARRKRMISAQETERVLRAVDTAAKTYERRR